LTIAVSDPGTIAHAPTALAAGSKIPKPKSPHVMVAPSPSDESRQWSLATPSPLGPGRICLSHGQVNDGKVVPQSYGISMASTEGWAQGVLNLEPMFDDPDFVDAEPVAVYPRTIASRPAIAPQESAPQSTVLADGSTYTGPLGKIHFNGLFIHEQENANAPGQITDSGKASAFPPFSKSSIDKIVFYATGRDQFHDANLPVLPGTLQRLVEAPVNKGIREGTVEVFVPTAEPTVLFGVDSKGKLARVTGAPDAMGTRATFYAIAGDHYSGVRANGYHFCTGCHAGHSHHAVPLVEQVK
jgi:hypothetical protein